MLNNFSYFFAINSNVPSFGIFFVYNLFQGQNFPQWNVKFWPRRKICKQLKNDSKTTCCNDCFFMLWLHTLMLSKMGNFCIETILTLSCFSSSHHFLCSPKKHMAHLCIFSQINISNLIIHKPSLGSFELSWKVWAQVLYRFGIY